MRLSVITINFNGSAGTINLLDSLSGQSDNDFDVYVVDNASSEADFNIVRDYIGKAGNKHFNLIRNDDNLGFSGGNNRGIRRALNQPLGGGSARGRESSQKAGDWVLLLNNDTWVEHGFIGQLRAKLSHLEGIAGLPLNEGGKTAYGGRISWLRATLPHYYSQMTEDRGDGYAIGGGVAVQAGVFEKIGLMDEKYFLYFEDADLSLRARKAGFPITFLNEPTAHHQVSESAKKLGSPLLLRYHYRNALYFNRKNGPYHIKALNWLWSFWIIKRQVLKIMAGYKQEESKAILNGVFDFYRGRMGKINN